MTSTSTSTATPTGRCSVTIQAASTYDDQGGSRDDRHTPGGRGHLSINQTGSTYRGWGYGG